MTREKRMSQYMIKNQLSEKKKDNKYSENRRKQLNKALKKGAIVGAGLLAAPFGVLGIAACIYWTNDLSFK